MFLKIMGKENCPDNDPRKTFRMLAFVADADFNRNDDDTVTVRVLFENGDQESFPVLANAYLMNDNGLTVTSFGAAMYRRPVTTDVAAAA